MINELLNILFIFICGIVFYIGFLLSKFLNNKIFKGTSLVINYKDGASEEITLDKEQTKGFLIALDILRSTSKKVESINEKR